jgi:hypothetical protein
MRIKSFERAGVEKIGCVRKSLSGEASLDLSLTSVVEGAELVSALSRRRRLIVGFGSPPISWDNDSKSDMPGVKLDTFHHRPITDH